MYVHIIINYSFILIIFMYHIYDMCTPGLERTALIGQRRRRFVTGTISPWLHVLSKFLLFLSPSLHVLI